MTEVTLKSGRVLRIQIAPFADASKLRKVVASELLSVNVEVAKLDLKTDLSRLDPGALNTMKNVACRLLSSDPVEAAFFACAARCTIDGAAIKRDTFENEDARGDFLPAAWEEIRANLAPFFEGLDLSSLTSGPDKTGGPPSGST
jgi:hypothetical protein